MEDDLFYLNHGIRLIYTIMPIYFVRIFYQLPEILNITAIQSNNASNKSLFFKWAFKFIIIFPWGKKEKKTQKQKLKAY